MTNINDITVKDLIWFQLKFLAASVLTALPAFIVGYFIWAIVRVINS